MIAEKSTASASKEHGIIFSAPMVRALLNTKPNVWPAEGIDRNLPFKFQTRRLVKPQPVDDPDGDGDNFASSPIECAWYHPTKIDRDGEEFPGEKVYGFWSDERGWKCPHAPGTRLWVRETWMVIDPSFRDPVNAIAVPDKSGIKRRLVYRADAGWFCDWTPAIHMPRWASRIDLLVKSVRVQRAQEIPPSDAIAEGFSSTDDFISLWRELHGEESWSSNPFVWVYEIGRTK